MVVLRERLLKHSTLQLKKKNSIVKGTTKSFSPVPLIPCPTLTQAKEMNSRLMTQRVKGVHVSS